MANKITGRRLYLLMPSYAPLEASIWSNLSKLYEFLKEKELVEIQSYSSVQKKIQSEGVYKFMIGDNVYRILVKYVE